MDIFHKIKILPDKSICGNKLSYRWGGQHIPAGLPYPQPKTLEQCLLTDTEMTFRCFISLKDQFILLSKHFLLVYNNQSLEMPWMVGGGGNLSKLVYVTPPPPPPPNMFE